MESSASTNGPSIDQSIKCLKDHLLSCIDQGIISQSFVKVYVSSMHLLFMIKQEQVSVAQYCKRSLNSNQDKIISEERNITFPTSNEIPTIHKILHDPALLHIFFICLSTPTLQNTLLPSKALPSDSSNPSETSNSYTKKSGSSGNAISTDLLGNTVTGNRKRSMSLSVETSAMSVKTNAFGTSPKLNPSLRGPIMNHSQIHKPMFNVHVLVTTILYSVLEHYDHWPTPLVQIYAEDCFGPRLWVDNKLCTLLTSNLALSHSSAVMNVAEIEEDVDMGHASVMAQTYRDYWNKNSDDIEKSEPTLSTSKTGPTFAMFLASSQSTSWRKNKVSNEHHAVKRQRTGGPRTFGSSTSHDSESEDDSSSTFQSSAPSAAHGDVTLELQPTLPHSDSKKRKLELSTMSSTLSVTQQSDSDNQTTRAEQDQSSALHDDAPLTREPGMEDGTIFNIAYRYPVNQQYLRFGRVRNRYRGENMKAAHDVILKSLIKRLETKSKQNSSLLQCLPSFMEIPGVRKQVAVHLEKWLQSPALAGLARLLFTSTVNHMRIIDPPLDDDLHVIDSIVRMNLKSNQLNAHIENVSAIAKKLPFSSVVTHLYSTLTNQLMAHDTVTATSDQLKMIAAVHRVVPSTLSYDALASVLLMLLVNPIGHVADETALAGMDRCVKIQKLRRILRILAAVLGSSFDGVQLLQSLVSFKITSTSWTRDDEDDKARLIFQCGTLAIGYLINDSGATAINPEALATPIRTVLKLLLTYCCTEYGPLFRCQGPLQMIDYFHNEFCERENDSSTLSWLVTMKCLLFLEPPESTHLKRFFSCGNEAFDATSEWEEELPRIKTCYQLGGELHSDLIWILLKSTSIASGIDPEMAIRLLENFLIRCSEKQPIALKVDDPKIIWELYNLVNFEPKDQLGKELDWNQLASIDFPRLAFPGLWWRVTMISLVFCANSPESIGMLVWREHPTLQAIMKMVTSQRFRFPTVDCNDVTKIEMKKQDYAAREEERRIAESLFLPPKPERKLNVQKGARVSRRIQMQQQEKAASKELAESRRRKALLDEAHKKIMIWDPDGPARRPPPESVDVLLAVTERFNLSHLFQCCIEPDFLLMSIGQTTRSAIERAYDWLIPIVSSIPAVISRLPSSASCLLLLRAYSTAGEEKKKLKLLLAPLLQHVTDSLDGLYGELYAVKAFDLLMSGVASKKADKRRCARKVLQDSLLSADSMKSHSFNLFACMVRILDLEHADVLVCHAIKHLFHAAFLERSVILPAVVMSLQKLIDFADSHKIDMPYQFPVILTRLICTRPIICMEALDSNVEFFDLTANALHAELSNYVKTDIFMAIGDAIGEPHSCKSTIVYGEIKVPLGLLQSLCVILSIWNHQNVSDESKRAIGKIADALLHRCESETDGTNGLAHVILMSGGRSLIPLENWIMLAKAKCNDIVRRAASTIPVEFLPRILLCSGLTRSSVITILQKLGQVVESAHDKHEIVVKLLTPTSLSEYSTHQIRNKENYTTKKLLGSIAAYISLYAIPFTVANPFLSSLFEEIDFSDVGGVTNEMRKKVKGTGSEVEGSMGSATSFLAELRNFEITPRVE